MSISFNIPKLINDYPVPTVDNLKKGAVFNSTDIIYKWPCCVNAA
jgi:hypothetical protein